MLLSSIFTMNLFVILVPAQLRTVLSDWLVVVCAGAVVAVSVAILYRQKFRGLYGRTYGVMAIGLLLWFSAEMIATFENYWITSSLNPSGGPIASTPSLQPSIADVVWLAGYGFFAYFLFRIMIHFSRSINLRVLIMLAVATAITAFILAQSISYYYALHGVSSPFSGTESAVGTNSNIKAISLFLHIEYPVLDLMLIIPALVVLLGVKDGKLTSTPWILLSAAIFILAVSDIGSIYSSVLNIEQVHWIWKMFATAAYLCIATSLFWYNRFFIFDAKRATKIWQEKNR